MKILFENAKIADVFTESIIESNLLIDDAYIVGIGDYTKEDADEVIDVRGKWICPGFIDGHIHIESTMLLPKTFAGLALKHGTTTVVTDPHEISNVCGSAGIEYMLRASDRLPLDILVNLPSCVPATDFDESMEHLTIDKLKPYLSHERVLGLAELMNYVGAIHGDKVVLDKVHVTKKANKIIDGHAPMLMGKDLNTYIGLGVNSDHECSGMEEAMARISRGMWVMIREGTAARNLEALSPLFDTKASNRCLLVTDDKEPSDLIENGHIDAIIRKAVKLGKNPLTGIRMATINAATCFGLKQTGAIAPGYKADFLILDDLDSVSVKDVYKNGKKVVENKETLPFHAHHVPKWLENVVTDSIKMKDVSLEDFHIEPKSSNVRVIEVIPGELITNELHETLDFSNNNGISVEKDILKLAVIERHKETGHIGLGFIKGIGLKRGAIASTVSHDSHNIIVIGTNDEDMLFAVQCIKQIGGGNVVVENQKLLSKLPLRFGGLMSDEDATLVAKECKEVRNTVYSMGVPKEIAPFMNMAFVSLPVIPSLKLTTTGLVDVNSFSKVDLFL